MVMSINDLDFDDEEPPNTDILKNCFPIYHLPTNKDDKFDSGTGFLINDDGMFLSAGHVFKEGNEIDAYNALFDGNEYQIKCIYREYNDEIAKDLFIGGLVNFNKKLPFCTTLGNSDLIVDGDYLAFAGYNIRKDILGKDAMSDYIMQHSEHTFYGHALTAKLVPPENIERYKCSIDKRLMSPIMKVLSKVPKECHGLSGGPVYSDSIIYGVLLADVFVTSNYISGRLEEQ